MMDVKIEQSWKDALEDEFGKPYFISLVRFLHAEKAAGKTIYPPGKDIFRAFELTPVDKVKAVILGQDPYHGPGQAMGLSFSVPSGVPAPPSLRNIFKEIHDDLGIEMSGYPDLEKWARQGVLLLNAVLTVQAGSPASHSNIGWTEFTDAVIRYLSDNRSGIVFLLCKKLMELLCEFPPKHFFCVSTDKAANPVNIMGASKRVMEDMVMAYSKRFPVTTARFANVAFSNGSLPD